MTLDKEENVNYKFTPGDVVKVRAIPGPNMLVRGVVGDHDLDLMYVCAWFEGGEGWRGTFHTDTFTETELELSPSYEFLSTDDEIL